jgi:hypothetical protein
VEIATPSDAGSGTHAANTCGCVSRLHRRYFRGVALRDHPLIARARAGGIWQARSACSGLATKPRGADRILLPTTNKWRWRRSSAFAHVAVTVRRSTLRIRLAAPVHRSTAMYWQARANRDSLSGDCLSLEALVPRPGPLLLKRLTLSWIDRKYWLLARQRSWAACGGSAPAVGS